jgi:hypothetical protein
MPASRSTRVIDALNGIFSGKTASENASAFFIGKRIKPARPAVGDDDDLAASAELDGASGTLAGVEGEPRIHLYGLARHSPAQFFDLPFPLSSNCF